MTTGLNAQISEMGIHFGGSYYVGDVNPTRHFYNVKTSQGLTFRYNLNVRLAARLNLINTTITGNDADFSNDFQKQRDYEFATQLNDFTAQIEFNFFPSWYEGQDNLRFTTYSAIGLGVLYMQNGEPSSIMPVLPVGLGGKMHISKHLSANIEWGMRFTYSDFLDKLANPYKQDAGQLTSRARQVTFAKNHDVYSIFGLMLTYRIFNQKHICPAYGNIK